MEEFMEHLKYFETMAQSLFNTEAESWKKNGGRIIGLQCSGIPEEIIHAAGILPMRVRAPGLQSTKNADAHLHHINCSYTRSMLELLMSGQLAFLDGFVSANTCDHHLRLAGEVEDKSQFQFLHYFRTNGTIGPGGKEWLLQEMKKLVSHVENAFETSISEETLRDTISIYNSTRKLMNRLNNLRKNDPPLLTGVEYMNIVLTGMSIPRETFNQRLQALLPELEKRRMPNRHPRLLILGGACDSPEFIDFIESKGAYIVADGICFGLRHYMGLIDETAKDLLEAIADRYLARLPCPAIVDGFEQSYKMLTEIIDETHVQGIVCTRLKFCDHYAASRRLLADQLRQDQSVPVIELEREYNTTKSGQLSTRIQAFLELL
jgi:benzoyl-CoA reductase subunit C